ncbi:MAG: signal peptidase II [Bdellovibrionales bacterium]|nr:signal peptidase II [Bdellovibrionales bacterium]
MNSFFSIWVPGVAIGVGDQFFKLVVTAEIPLLKRVPVLGQNFLALTRVYNRGLMNDQLSDMPSGMIETYTRYLPTAIWLLLTGLAISQFKLSGRRARQGMIALLIGGASNLFDHYRIQYTIDTFQIYRSATEHIPFNLADLGILGGGSIWLYTILKDVMWPVGRPIRK